MATKFEGNFDVGLVIRVIIAATVILVIVTRIRGDKCVSITCMHTRTYDHVIDTHNTSQVLHTYPGTLGTRV